jgi:hypothetical protein
MCPLIIKKEPMGIGYGKLSAWRSARMSKQQTEADKKAALLNYEEGRKRLGHLLRTSHSLAMEFWNLSQALEESPASIQAEAYTELPDPKPLAQLVGELRKAEAELAQAEATAKKLGLSVP